MDIFSNNTIFFFIIGAVFVLFLFMPSKASANVVRKMITNCNDAISDYNAIMKKIANIQDDIFALSKINTYQIEKINKISKNVNSLYEDSLMVIDKMVLYTKRKNYQYYNKNYNILKAYLEQFEEFYEELKLIYEEASLEEDNNMENEYYEKSYDDSFNNESENNFYINTKPASEYIFFAGCDTEESVEKRYKSLAKVYHPDTLTGDTETFQQINNEHERKKRSLKGGQN